MIMEENLTGISYFPRDNSYCILLEVGEKCSEELKKRLNQTCCISQEKYNDREKEEYERFKDKLHTCINNLYTGPEIEEYGASFEIVSEKPYTLKGVCIWAPESEETFVNVKSNITRNIYRCLYNKSFFEPYRNPTFSKKDL